MDLKDLIDRRSILKMFGIGCTGIAAVAVPEIARATESLSKPKNPETAQETVTITETVFVEKNHFETWVKDMTTLFGINQCKSYTFTSYSGYVIVNGYQKNKYRLDKSDVPIWFESTMDSMLNVEYERRAVPINDRAYVNVINAFLKGTVTDVNSLRVFVERFNKEKQEKLAAKLSPGQNKWASVKL